MGPHQVPETRGFRPARVTEVDCITHRRPRQCSIEYWTWPLQYEYLQIPRSGLVQYDNKDVSFGGGWAMADGNDSRAAFFSYAHADDSEHTQRSVSRFFDVFKSKLDSMG